MIRTIVFLGFFIFLGFNQLVLCEKTEADASEKIKNYNIAFEKNYEWIEKLKATSKSLLGFSKAFQLKYEIRDIIIFLKNITDDMREYNYEKFRNEILKRQFKVILENNYYNLPKEETIAVAEAIDKWNDEYIDADEEEPTTYCHFKEQSNCTLSFPKVLSMIAASNDAPELKWYSIQLLDRDAAKRDKRYLEFLELFNKAAKLNGFSSSYDMLIAPYEDKTIGETIERTKNEIKPLYDMIHFDQLKKLQSENYGLTANDKLIPQYLWIKILPEQYDPTKKTKYPIENAGNADYTTALKEKVNSSMEIYEIAKTFFNSLGLDTEKIKYNVVVDENSPKFVDKFGRKQLELHLSPQLTELKFVRTFTQMLNMVQYQYSYEKQPYALRKLRPRAFSWALGNAIALSVQSPTYWHKLGFVEKSSLGLPHLINRLYKFALVLLLPLSEHYVIADTMKCIQQQKSNSTSKCDYWGKKKGIQGVFLEGRTSDLEVIISKHNGLNIDDYEDIFSIIVGFQIYEGLCKKVGQYSDKNEEKYLAQCDLSDNKQVGEILGEIMTDAGSKPWQEHFRKLSDDVDISAKSLLKYFEPLQKYLSDKTQ